MAKPYQIIQDYYPSAMHEGKMKEAIKSLPGPVENLPGMKILNTMPKPTNFLQLFNTFVTFVHHPGNGYRWDGRIKGGSAYKLLDGDVKSSECATFANAFMMLVWAPATLRARVSQERCRAAKLQWHRPSWGL